MAILPALPLIYSRPCAPQAGQRARPGTPKGQGLVLEAQVGAVLPDAVRGQWFHYRTFGSRERWCQTDFLFWHHNTLAIIECKFSYHPTVRQQLLQVYKPVVEEALQRRAICIAVIRRPPTRQQFIDAISLGQEFTILR